MVKDSKRFADSGGWGWGSFNYDAASDTCTPATLADNPPRERRQVWVRVPYDSEDKGLCVHGVPEAVNGDRFHFAPTMLSYFGPPGVWHQLQADGTLTLITEGRDF